MKKRYLALIIISFFLFVAGTIDLGNLLNYSNQSIPNYINRDNTPGNNAITDAGATLGRVLFYDKNLSLNMAISCSSCHKQEFAFGDTDIQSTGFNGGLTGRHSMRLVNPRFAQETNFFWDERASSLEEQTTQPIKDALEMGFSGNNGQPTIDSLFTRLENIYYYNELFNLVYGDITVTESRIQDALAQFIRSIQSFDSKFDVGLAAAGNVNANFSNYTTEENNGKTLYLSNNITGCNRCHRVPEFDIDPNSNNNGVVGIAGGGGSDFTNERSPSLRDMVNTSGVSNGPLMHDGSLATIRDVINHYNDIDATGNPNLDNRLNGGPGGNGQNLNLTETQKDELEAFLFTLAGSDMYTNEKWSDPFDASGNLIILNGSLPVTLVDFTSKVIADEVILEWTTFSELNNEGFEVEHSVDGLTWNALGFVSGAGNSLDEHLYSFTHYNPKSGNNYYRLRQIDFDGTESYSDILTERIDALSFAVNVFPNPTSDYLTIDADSENLNLTLYNQQGFRLFNKNIGPNEKLDLTHFDSGVYFLEIQNLEGQQSPTLKIVKY